MQSTAFSKRTRESLTETGVFFTINWHYNQQALHVINDKLAYKQDLFTGTFWCYIMLCHSLPVLSLFSMKCLATVFTSTLHVSL